MQLRSVEFRCRSTPWCFGSGGNDPATITIHTRWCPRSIAFSWFITTTTRVYHTQITIVFMGFINQLITGGAHLVVIPATPSNPSIPYAQHQKVNVDHQFQGDSRRRRSVRFGPSDWPMVFVPVTLPHRLRLK